MFREKGRIRMNGMSGAGSGGGIDPRHLAVISAAAGAMAQRAVRLRHIAVISAAAGVMAQRAFSHRHLAVIAAAAATVATGPPVRGRKVIMMPRTGAGSWVTIGRARLMAAHRRNQL